MRENVVHLRGHEFVIDGYNDSACHQGPIKGDDETHRVLAHDGNAIALSYAHILE